jgi:hypothetical protein
LLDHGIDPVLPVRFAAAGLDQRLDAIRFHRLFVTVKRVTGYAHDPAGFGYVVQLFGQIQKTNLVPYNILCTMQHEGYLFMVLIEGLSTPIKTGNPHFFKRGVRSDRNFYK